MQILTTGGMEDFCKHLGIRMLSLICCMFWIFSTAEGNSITGVVGSKVILKCKNDSNGTINQLTWKRNGVLLIGFMPPSTLHRSPEAVRLNINMSKSQLNTLVIERAQTSHTGNYTCEITKDEAVLGEKWELIIKDAENSDQLWIVVAVVVPCVCCLIFILALTILLRVRKRRAGDNSPNADMEREEDIYENCLETDVGQRRGHNQRYHCITRTR
ncbi:uncharacterized protein LOC141782551 isoform X1 [Sebastes fasciatus]|uniref:uncharacterized protein LOC141782551 isoform X1 n=1 Tax=Sebastes fasciatus TaxID=394691 RepID=UPI003D9F59AA